MAGMAGEDARPYIFGGATCAEQDNPMSSRFLERSWRVPCGNSIILSTIDQTLLSGVLFDHQLSRHSQSLARPGYRGALRVGEQIEDVWDKRLSRSRGGGGAVSRQRDGSSVCNKLRCRGKPSVCPRRQRHSLANKRQPVDGPRLVEHGYQDNDVDSVRAPIRVSSFSLPRTS